MFYNDKGRPTVEWLSALEAEAATRRAAGLRRELVPRDPGDPVVDLAGNDYLGLSRHPEVLAAAAQALLDFGLGATGSRLVRGSTAAHRDLEAGLAGLLGFERALVYSSGYLANLGAVRTLARPGALVVSDAHNHASLIDGCRLARCETVVAPHQDPDFVRRELSRHPGRPAVVVTESIFSVDGDLAPLPELYEVTSAHGAVLLVDDAHALGVIGPSGAGGVAAAGLSGAPGLVVTATLSKSLGAAGGVIAGPRQLHRELLDTGRTFIFDTALPPAVAAGALTALRLLESGDDLRAELHARARRAVERLRSEGLEVSEPAGGVISVAAPSPDEAYAWAAACRERGVAVGCFRPPSTPDGRSRLRLTIGVGVPAADFDQAVDIIAKERP
ncbi:8-amino-7-oxononanoate synthase [Dactylosporangium darangshiense]|uniref:8-amino-7-oxononanoate synthase n=1 Tax=Dactylosporangium darangshiense TaxID=579108 RepID=A0ABP8DEM0_9ACTN